MSEKSFAAVSVVAAVVWGAFFYPPAKVAPATPVPEAAAVPVARPVIAVHPAPKKQAAPVEIAYPDPGTERGGRTAGLAGP